MLNLSLVKEFNCVVSFDSEVLELELNLSTDSRNIANGDAFICLKGEKFDAIDFVPQVISKGAKVIICEDSSENKRKLKGLLEGKSLYTIFVTDTYCFLEEMAKAHLDFWKQKTQGCVVAVAGSNGKTTTKDILLHLLEAIDSEAVVGTKGNLNNHIGVPLTLFQLHTDHKFCVVELGTNSPGEIEKLCHMAQPSHGILTSIGHEHLEFFKDLEGVFEEESTLFRYLKESGSAGYLVMNADDFYLNRLLSYERSLSFSASKETKASYYVEYSSTSVCIEIAPDKTVRLSNSNLTGKHNFQNLVSSFLMAYALYPNMLEELVRAASSFTPKLNRSSWVKENGREYFLDAYNANPSSVEAAIEGFLNSVKARGLDLAECFFILGDMNELGDQAESLHVRVGSYLKTHSIENVAFIGRYSAYYQKGFLKHSTQCNSVKEFRENHWPSVLQNYKLFFVKGSRSLQLEGLLDIS